MFLMARLRAASLRSAPRRCQWLLYALVGLSGGLAAPGCELSEPGKSEAGNAQGPSHRPQSLALTPEQERELGRQAYAQVLREFRGRVLPGDRPEVNTVRHITARVVRAAAIRPLQ